ncbi:YigZ family protein [Phanerochaete sordida]|uniref:YigZ family protein n=1 Tax=Phanerochaete sordida TaxID=48140 RepID=A0A9P3G642_9APHY|nr:YigZ family protein [Phanerochaete sordida]
MLLVPSRLTRAISLDIYRQSRVIKPASLPPTASILNRQFAASSSGGDASAWSNTTYSSSRHTLHKSTFEAYVSTLSPLSLLGLADNPVKSCPNSTSAPMVTSAAEVTRRLTALFEELERINPRVKRATHCMYAWRVIPPNPESAPLHTRTRPKRGATTRDVPTAVAPGGRVISGSVSGGESGAGERLERLLELSSDCKGRSVVLVVYRWYGGVKLGSDRWKCISSVAKEALGAASENGWK